MERTRMLRVGFVTLCLCLSARSAMAQPIGHWSLNEGGGNVFHSDFGGGLFDSEAMQTFRQMQDEQFADIASRTGAFGIAAAIEAQLAARLGMEGR